MDEFVTFTPFVGDAGTVSLRYTVEGAAGNRADEMVEILLPFQVDRLVREGGSVRVKVPTSDSDAFADWMRPEFDDSEWREGVTAIGYDTMEDGEFGVNVSEMIGQSSSVWARIPFEIAAPSDYVALSLRMRFDDGFIAYLNGEEVARVHAEGGSPLDWDALATADNPETQVAAGMVIDITKDIGLLRTGRNVLAVHGLNASPLSSDFLLIPELDAAIHGEIHTRSIAIPEGVGLLLKGRLPEGGANSGEGWTVESVPDGGSANFADRKMHKTTVQFSKNGRYLLKNSALSEDGDLVTSMFEVMVGSLEVSLGELGDYSIFRVDGQTILSLGPSSGVLLDKVDLASGKVCVNVFSDLREIGYSGSVGAFVSMATTRASTESFQVKLEPHVIGNHAKVRFEKIRGPGSVKFLPSEGGNAIAQFSEIGDYELRVIVVTEAGISTFADTAVTVLQPLPGGGGDLDGDQIPDFIEWALGSNPIDGGIGLNHLPRLTRSRDESIFTYPVRSDAQANALSYVVEVSSDLNEWITPNTKSVSMVGDRIEERFPAGANAMFFRLRFDLSE